MILNLPKSEGFNPLLLSLTRIALKTTKPILIKSVMGNCNSGYIKIRFYKHNGDYCSDVVYQRKNGFGQIYSSIVEQGRQHNPFTQHDYDLLINTYIREW